MSSPKIDYNTLFIPVGYFNQSNICSEQAAVESLFSCKITYKGAVESVYNGS